VQAVTTNKPNTKLLFTGSMPFLSPNRQCQSTEGKFLCSTSVLITCTVVLKTTLHDPQLRHTTEIVGRKCTENILHPYILGHNLTYLYVTAKCVDCQKNLAGPQGH